MASFLRQILETLSIRDTSFLKDACFVFPTRRACHYFKEELGRYYAGSSFILPEIITIEDFVIRHSSKVIPDELSLLLTLHGIFNKFQPQPFEDFYTWGRMVLKDFEEIDKYLVDAQKLYTVLQEHREMEETWALDDASLAVIREFWGNVADKGSTPHKDYFLQTWQLLGGIYLSFQDTLNNAGTAHKGMAYRSLAERLIKGEISFPYNKLVFAGFNALSVAEEKIFSACLLQGNTHLFWDADLYYLENQQQEAGNFIRHYREVFKHPHSHWIVEDLLSKHHHLFISGIPSMTGQAQEIARLINEGSMSVENTAIVLCDEQLLMPLLHALPKQENGINITMGYPVRHCVPFQLLEICFQLYLHKKDFSGQEAYFYKGILALTGHSLIQQWIGADHADNIADAISSHNRIWASLPWIEAKTGTSIPPLSFLLDTPPGNGTDFGEKMALLFEHLLQLHLPPLDAHVCRSLLDNIRSFNAILSSHGQHMTLSPYYKILRQVLHAGSIPFEGSDSKALQVMGFLETRLLDFDKIIVLSANEQHLPAPNRHRSFIPYHLRKGFGMSTFEEQDAIYAYHFYRLIQRTSEAYIYFNTSGNNSDHEPSRFLMQLRREHPYIHENKHGSIPAKPVNRYGRWAERIVIPKDEKSIQLLQRRVFSASSLITYLVCPVQFYLQYIAGLGNEEEEVQETMDNRVMGQILHKTMELCYTPWTGKQVPAEAIAKMSKTEEVVLRLREAFQEELGESSLDIAEGKNYLIFEILKDIVSRFLSWDLALAPFTIVGLEEKINVPFFSIGGGKTAALTGRIDRRDLLGINGVDCDRVIDYKTGKVNIAPKDRYKKLLSPEEYIDQYFKEGAGFKEGFQGYFYNMLLEESLPLKNPSLTGFYGARDFAHGINYLQEGMPIPAEIRQLFRERITLLIAEILDPDMPFMQSNKPRAYEYSPFAELVP